MLQSKIVVTHYVCPMGDSNTKLSRCENVLLGQYSSNKYICVALDVLHTMVKVTQNHVLVHMLQAI
jgi:hypothetical protein